MTLKDWAEVGPDPLAFPINGKTYTPPEISAARGIQILRLESDDKDQHITKLSFDQIMLGCSDQCAAPADDPDADCGAVFHQMLADGVSQRAIRRASIAMQADWRYGREVAERIWAEGLDPEVLASPEEATPTQPSTPPAAAPTTPTPASGTSTRTKKTTAKKTARKSAGSNSSSAST